MSILLYIFHAHHFSGIIAPPKLRKHIPTPIWIREKGAWSRQRIQTKKKKTLKRQWLPPWKTQWHKRSLLLFLFSLFRILFQPILARNEFILVFFKFFNFFVIFLEFSITHRVGMKQNDNFYFPSLSALSNLFWLEMNP